MQVIGSHNSYKQPTTPEIYAVLSAFDPVLASSLEYDHPPIAEQLEQQGVRQLELDVFADPAGGAYARRVGLGVVGLPNDPPPELLQPGFKVLHIQDLDFNSSCLTFVDCLEQVDAWSDANPTHLPVAILVELKDEPIPDPFNFGFTVPTVIGGPELDQLDAEIRSVFGRSELITPDDVRGRHGTLEEAVLAGRWPTLEDAQGKVMFMMDNGGRHRDLYRAGRPSLEGRVLFTNATPGSPDAAFVKVNQPVGNVEQIQQLVAAGYVVRTRSDEPTVQARSGDTTQREAALASGAQWVSTDYPVPGSSPFSDYFAAIPDGDPARCNPVNTGPRCRNDGPRGPLSPLTGRGRRPRDAPARPRTRTPPTRARAAAPMRARPSGSSRSRARAPVSAAASPVGTITPSSPSVIRSRIAPRSGATTVNAGGLVLHQLEGGVVEGALRRGEHEGHVHGREQRRQLRREGRCPSTPSRPPAPGLASPPPVAPGRHRRAGAPRSRRAARGPRPPARRRGSGGSSRPTRRRTALRGRAGLGRRPGRRPSGTGRGRRRSA